ncbi:MAG: MoaD/ThiS family protein [Chloroflexi bacterium]|nr:MoaD/ThiS family protein [Chloroflexota bacterium]
MHKSPHPASIEIEIEVIPWLTELLDPPRAQRVKWREEIALGDPVCALLAVLNRSCPRLASAVYDPQAARLTGNAHIILNDRALELVGGLDALLHDGDRLVLVPAYVGG